MSTESTFYGGTPHVCLKDAIFESSTAMRHITELDELLNQHPVRPIHFIYTDGGPDHRTTFITVQLAYIALFLSRNLDALFVLRTPPNLSVLNPAERCMPLLNLCLYGCALERKELGEAEEGQMKSFKTKKQWRAGALSVCAADFCSMTFFTLW